MISQFQVKPEANIHKIAVVRANALGDFIFALPALDALRLTYPAAEIVLLGRPWHVDFLKDRLGPIDQLVVVPPCKGVGEHHPDFVPTPQNLRDVEQLLGAMVGEQFDLAVQIHGGGLYSNPFTRRLGARLSIGMYTPDAELLDRTIPYVYYQSEILRYLEVVKLAGATNPDIEPRLAVTAADLAEALRIVPATAKPLVGLHPGASVARRRWSPRYFAQIADALVEAGTQVVLTGTPPEQPLIDELLEAMLPRNRREVQSVCGQLSLNGLTGLLSRCKVVVSNDSGPLHLAGAVGAATVGIYWCGNLINAGPFYRTRHRPQLSWRLNCPVCAQNCILQQCQHQVSFVDDVPVSEVRAATLDLL